MDRFEDALARSRSGRLTHVLAPGRTDLVRDTDDVIANFLSMSFAAPELFGDGLDAFVADMRALLATTSPTGRFWDWPGDTAVVLAVKPYAGYGPRRCRCPVSASACSSRRTTRSATAR